MSGAQGSKGIDHLWRRLDRSLLASVTKIRSTEHLGPQDTALMALPIKLGGLGVLTFEICAAHAFQAAAESADLVLAPLLNLNHQESTEPKSQRERCQAAFLTGGTLSLSL